eukprot:2716479-Rhodomonas_salina.7
MPEPANQADAGAGDGKPVFIKKARKGNFRKKEKVEDEEESVDVRKAIEETRKEQKFRVRGAGVDAEKLATSETTTVKKVVDEEEQPAGSALGSLLDSQVSSGQVRTDRCPDTDMFCGTPVQYRERGENALRLDGEANAFIYRLKTVQGWRKGGGGGAEAYS